MIKSASVQWYPTLYEGTTPVEPKKTPEEGYHFMADMTDKAMAWVAQQKALAPDKIKGKTQLLFGGMGRLSENCVLSIKNKSHSVTAKIEVPEAGAEGVIIAQGANIGEDAVRIAMARQ